MMILISIKQHLSNVWILFLEKLSNTEAELKKSVTYKKELVFYRYNFKALSGRPGV